MSKKIRLIRTLVMEYEPDCSRYPAGTTLEQIAQAEQYGFWPDRVVSDDVRYELVGEEETGAEESEQQKFPVGCFVKRGGECYQVLANEGDFVGRVYDRRGQIIDPFYFDYDGMSSERVTDPQELAQLDAVMQVVLSQQKLTGEMLLAVGFTLNTYGPIKVYELNMTNFDRATEIAELAGMKYDKHAGVHHVILQCNEQLQNCIFFCDNEYWEVPQDVFAELVRKL